MAIKVRCSSKLRCSERKSGAEYSVKRELVIWIEFVRVPIHDVTMVGVERAKSPYAGRQSPAIVAKLKFFLD
jgi:hypothetical protein